MDLALNNLQMLICHKTQTNKQTNKQTNIYVQEKAPVQLRIISAKCVQKLYIFDIYVLT